VLQTGRYSLQADERGMIRSSLMWRVALAMAAAVASAPLCFGWGEEGHRLVVEIAEGLMTPAAKARVAATLMPGETLEEMASWADEVRRARRDTEEWHYVDIPLMSAGLDMKRDCPKGSCVVAKISDFRKAWRDPSLSAESRREALLFLVHFVGDLHQPLHCEDHDDRGGNDVRVSFLKAQTNLHALWDSGLLRNMAGEDRLLAALRRAITAEEAAAWSGGTVEQWADESLHAAQATVYGLLPATPTGQAAPIGEWYEQMAEPVVEQQLEKAGVRLAAILNAGAQ
jgi:S1/P1 Nuclease